VTEQERSHAISAKDRVANSAFLKSDFEILAFFNTLGFFYFKIKS